MGTHNALVAMGQSILCDYSRAHCSGLLFPPHMCMIFRCLQSIRIIILHLKLMAQKGFSLGARDVLGVFL